MLRARARRPVATLPRDDWRRWRPGRRFPARCARVSRDRTSRRPARTGGADRRRRATRIGLRVERVAPAAGATAADGIATSQLRTPPHRSASASLHRPRLSLALRGSLRAGGAASTRSCSCSVCDRKAGSRTIAAMTATSAPIRANSVFERGRGGEGDGSTPSAEPHPRRPATGDPWREIERGTLRRTMTMRRGARVDRFAVRTGSDAAARRGIAEPGTGGMPCPQESRQCDHPRHRLAKWRKRAGIHRSWTVFGASSGSRATRRTGALAPCRWLCNPGSGKRPQGASWTRKGGLAASSFESNDPIRCRRASGRRDRPTTRCSARHRKILKCASSAQFRDVDGARVGIANVLASRAPARDARKRSRTLTQSECCCSIDVDVIRSDAQSL